MTKTIITLTTKEKPNPGTLNHLAAMISNSNNHNAVTVEQVNTPEHNTQFTS